MDDAPEDGAGVDDADAPDDEAPVDEAPDDEAPDDDPAGVAESVVPAVGCPPVDPFEDPDDDPAEAGLDDDSEDRESVR